MRHKLKFEEGCFNCWSYIDDEDIFDEDTNKYHPLLVPSLNALIQKAYKENPSILEDIYKSLLQDLGTITETDYCEECGETNSTNELELDF